MNKIQRIAIPGMAVWLVACVIFSWAGVLDDALIHLRYADNLLHTHRISYDGVHPDYGASSLLYVTLLAFLRSFTSSPNLPHALSSVVHLVLFAGVAFLLTKLSARRPSQNPLPGLIFLLLLVVPSAVRWLDDGMETGIVLCFTLMICWFTFQISRRTITVQSYIGLVLLGFFTVMLRTELSLLCAIAFAILTLKDASSDTNDKGIALWWKAALRSSHLPLGAVLAMTTIFLTMHVLLPDTAVAKSHGISIWLGILKSMPNAIGGGFSFGVGMLLLWLLTLFLLLRAGRSSLVLLIANSIFPLIVFLASIRGQEVQGVRYFEWTLVFSAFWNILELSEVSSLSAEQEVSGRRLGYILLALVLIEQPIEMSRVFPIMSGRSKLVAMAPGQHLEVLQGKLGIAADIGIIGYFSKANICDLSGLVNGREFARLSTEERIKDCVAKKPNFLYLNSYEVGSFSVLEPAVADWKICGEFEMDSVSFKDIHYLIVPPSTAEQICRETSGARPWPVSRVLEGHAHDSPLVN